MHIMQACGMQHAASRFSILNHRVRMLAIRRGEAGYWWCAGARAAIDSFCHAARKHLGAYLTVLGGADAVVFGGGIGEHAASIRARICAGLDWGRPAHGPARERGPIAGRTHLRCRLADRLPRARRRRRAGDRGGMRPPARGTCPIHST